MFNELKKYNYIGIRGINTNEIGALEIGQKLNPSYAWDWTTQESSYSSEEQVEIGTCAIEAIDQNSSYWTNLPEERENEKESMLAFMAERIAYAKLEYDYDKYYVIGSMDRDWNCINDDENEINMIDPIVIAEV